MRKRYQAIGISLILLIGMILPRMSFAEESILTYTEAQEFAKERRSENSGEIIWPVQRLVPPDKEWTIRLSEAADEKSINEEGNIDVYHSDGRKHKIRKIKQDNKIIILPEENYSHDNYRLVIQNLRSESKKKIMSRKYIMNFKVQEECPVGGLALWEGRNITYPTFTVSKDVDEKGEQLTLGLVVKDINTNLLVGRIIEIKKDSSGYQVTMDKKCVDVGENLHQTKQRRMYSFGNAKVPSFVLGASGEERRQWNASDNNAGSYTKNMRPGDIIYHDPDPTHGQSQQSGIPNSQPEMDYVGVVTQVEKSDNGDYIVEVKDKKEEVPPRPYDPVEEPYNPPLNPIPSPENLRTIDGHMHHTVFIRDGQLYSMGHSPAMRSLLPKRLEGLDGPFKQVAAESQSGIVLSENGEAYRYVQESGGRWMNIREDNPAFGQMEIKQVAAGDDFYLILNSAGEVWRHGDNSYFGADSPNLHASSNNEESTTSSVAGEESAEAMMQEELHRTIAVSTPTKRPVSLPGRVKQIDAVGKVALALMENGDLYMWGKNANAQIDPQKASGQPKQRPFKVDGLPLPIKMAQTDGDRTVVLASDGTVYFWGKKWEGLGNAEGITRIDNLSDITKIAVKKQHMLALRGDGNVFSIGSNGFGELGISHSKPEGDRVFKVAFNGALMKDIGVGDNTSYAVSEGGKMWVWGNNINGQLGLGTRGSRATVYYPVLLYSIEEQVDFSFR